MIKMLQREIIEQVKQCGFDLNDMLKYPIIRPYNYRKWDLCSRIVFVFP